MSHPYSAKSASSSAALGKLEKGDDVAEKFSGNWYNNGPLDGTRFAVISPSRRNLSKCVRTCFGDQAYRRAARELTGFAHPSRATTASPTALHVEASASPIRS